MRDSYIHHILSYILYYSTMLYHIVSWYIILHPNVYKIHGEEKKTWKTLNMPASKAPAAHKAAQATSREGRLASPELLRKYTKHLTQRNLLTKRTLLLKMLWIASRALSIDILSWCPDVLHAKPILELHLVPLGGTCVEGASCHYSMEFCETGGFSGLSSTSSAMLN